VVVPRRLGDQHSLGRSDVRRPLSALVPPQWKRFALGVLLLLEALGGLLILFVRVAFGGLPGLELHAFAGLALTVTYALYQIGHWRRVAPWRARPDYILGLIAALSMAATNLTGLALAWIWWRAERAGIPAAYPTPLSSVHTLGTMLVLTFSGAHLAAVLQRESVVRPGRSGSR
jgi:hypothetical protein